MRGTVELAICGSIARKGAPTPYAMERGGMISGRQIREARALLQWDVSELETRTGIDVAVILRAEKVDGTPAMTLFQAGTIQQAFEHAGVRFGRGGGIVMAAGKNQA